MDFKALWYADRDVARAVAQFPEKVRSIVIGNLIIALVMFAGVYGVLAVLILASLEKPLIWIVAVIWMGACVVATRPVLFLIYDTVLFWRGLDSRIGRALAYGQELKRKASEGSSS